MYSQNLEEQWIADHFGDKVGKFLDIGAYDGKTFSNTLKLVENGWSGVCVEPSPTVIKELMSLHEVNGSVLIVNTAVTVNGGLVTFYDSGGDAVSTVDENHKILWKDAVNFTRVLVNSVTMTELFSAIGYEFDFINLDVEGINLELFSELPLGRLERCSALCVEHNGVSEDRQDMMLRASLHGYRVTQTNAENLFFTR